MIRPTAAALTRVGTKANEGENATAEASSPVAAG
jgi:hypothetical protein